MGGDGTRPPPAGEAGAEQAAGEAGAEQACDGGGPRRASWWGFLAPVALLVVLIAALSVLLLSRPGSPAPQAGTTQPAAGRGFFGTLALPARQAPAIDLRNYLGQPVRLAQYRGRAVLVTFLYTHCPDACPLITSNLRVALNRLGRRASRAQVIAVSVDASGDTPAAVAAFLRAHEMVGRMQYAIGSAAQLGRTWAAWGVGSTREAGHADLVEHSALVYGVSASGRITTLYPDTFDPAQIVHDVPLLATR